MEKKMRKGKCASDIVLDIVVWLVVVIVVVATLYPILNTIAVSFNEGIDSIRGGIHIWPRMFTLANYKAVFRNGNLGQAALVSVARTVIGTVMQLFLTAMLAYVLSRKEFIFNRQLSFMYVLTMYVSGGMIPFYILIKDLGLLNNFWVYILPGLASAFNMIVIRTYINGIPDSLIESAKIDGAGDFRIFVQIILPLCKPVLATVALFIAVGQWNSWFDSMLYCSANPKLTTLQYELMKLLSSTTTQGQSAETMKHAANITTPTSIRAAITIVTALPIVCLYPFLQRYFVTGLTIGGVKE